MSNTIAKTEQLKDSLLAGQGIVIRL